jgi:predicted metal-binding membrane protein
MAALGRRLASPRGVAWACVLALALLGWFYLGLLVAAAGSEGGLGALGPGMGLLAAWLGPAAAPWLQALCAAPFAGAGSVAPSLAGLAALFAMWVAMALAMMLPTAAPMLLTYAELVETAAERRQAAASPLVLGAGYLAVWVGFAVVAGALTAAVIAVGAIQAAMAPLAGWPAAAIFALAGLYQFSALKTACLKACQSPFRFFFANWTDRAWGVFRLGLRQGLYCLGCCWAAMLLMFAVGVMNVVWMAALGILMTIEKTIPGDAVRRTLGGVLLSVSVAIAWREAGMPLP